MILRTDPRRCYAFIKLVEPYNLYSMILDFSKSEFLLTGAAMWSRGETSSHTSPPIYTDLNRSYRFG
jgi:hypothetical protein